MKKLSILFVALFASFGVTLSPDATAPKVMWDNLELKSGQIGRVTILQKTALFKVEGGTSGPVHTFDPVRELKPGEVYRIYGTKTIQGYAPLYDVGGGFYVIQSVGYNIGHLKFETPSKAKLSLVNKK